MSERPKTKDANARLWDEAALRALGSSGVAVRASENAGQDAVDDAHRTALAPLRQDDGTYRIDALFRCLVAQP